ncbi:MAG TPA: LysR family transcriptional regulator substrate-binding protein, partial [Kribbella sp.]|nr:LysR family transcriptional regulator substrate-binding protein [Kribbella sp.]
VSNTLLPRVIGGLREAHPGCDIRLFEEETDSPDLTHLDLMFFDGRGGDGIGNVKLLDDPYFLVARPGDFEPGPVRLGKLDGLPLVAHPAICHQAVIEDFLRARDIRPQFVFRTEGNEALLAMVRSGLGVALMPRLAVLRHDESLALHELAPGLPSREICLLWQAGRTHSPLATHAIELALEAAADLS